MGPPRSSKKRPQANRAHCCVKEISCWEGRISQGAVECAILSASSPIPATTAAPRITDSTASEHSPDSSAGLFGFSSRKQSHNDSDDNENRDRDPNIERRDQTRAGLWSGSSGRRGRCVFRHEHSLYVL